MSEDQEKQLNEHFQTIQEDGSKLQDPGLRALIFGILDNLSRIERELDQKDRSKREIRKILKDLKDQGFEALKRIPG